MSLSAADAILPRAAGPGASGRGAAETSVPMVHSFAGFRFDPGAGLERHGRRIPLAPTESRMLVTLLQAGGRVVTKDELAQRVWSGGAASDNSISRAVCAIRRTLRRYTDEQIVETVYASGFRIAVPVELAPAPWRTRTAPASVDLSPAALACLEAARELLKRGRPADVQCAAVEIDRAVRLLSGDVWRWTEPAT